MSRNMRIMEQNRQKCLLCAQTVVPLHRQKDKRSQKDQHLKISQGVGLGKKDVFKDNISISKKKRLF